MLTMDSEKRRQARFQERHKALPKANSGFEKEEGTFVNQSRCQNKADSTINNDVVNHSDVDANVDKDKSHEVNFQEIARSPEEFRDGSALNDVRMLTMDSSEKRRRARLQGRHKALPKGNSGFEKEEGTFVNQSRCQNKGDSTINNDVINHSAVDANVDKDKSHEVDFQETTRNPQKFRDGRQRSQRYNFSPKKRDIKRRHNIGDRQSLTDGNIDETVQYLNGLSVNIDGTGGPASRGTHKDERHRIPKNNRYVAHRSPNDNSYFHTDTREQNYTSYPAKHYSRRRNMRNRARFDRTRYSTDKRYFKETTAPRTYSSEYGTEVEHFGSMDNKKSNYQLTKDPSKKEYKTNASFQRQGTSSSSRFVYEETHQPETIQKARKPITLNITGWHTMVQRDPEHKESFLYFKPDFLHEDERGQCFFNLKESIKWQEKEIVIRGEKYTQPRLVAWFGPLPYSYSNTVLESNSKFPPVIMDIKERIENILRKEKRDVTFNSVLLNMYRNGKDSVAWHSDDELSMGIEPTIASISLGETRRFEMKMKQNQYHQREDTVHQQENEEYVIFLTSGSLLVMDGAMQQYWLHRVPKEFHDKDCRINLTFRTVYPMEEK